MMARPPKLDQKSLATSSSFVYHTENTVDGRNPAPPRMYETPKIMGYLLYQPLSRISSINGNISSP